MSILPSIARVEAVLFDVRDLVEGLQAEKNRGLRKFATLKGALDGKRAGKKWSRRDPKAQLRRCSLSRVMQDPSHCHLKVEKERKFKRLRNWWGAKKKRKVKSRSLEWWSGAVLFGDPLRWS